MNLASARDFVRQFARNAGDSSIHPDANIDRAIQLACDEFLRRTRLLRTVSTLSLSLGSAALPALPTGFRPERLIRAYIAGQGELDVTDHATLAARRLAYNETGLPEIVAFTSWTSGEVYPTPGSAYTLSLLWHEPMVTWTPGAAGSSVTPNIPDDQLRPILCWGATAYLMMTEESNQSAVGKCRDEFERFIASQSGSSIGGHVGGRAMAEF